jgi:DNA mismatch repair protein MLH1
MKGPSMALGAASSSAAAEAVVPRIQRLDDVVINRIAAGEVVQKPSAAIKEMMENSIDAGCTAITVIAKGGGLDFLQIQDNGHGIHVKDLPILCERFTTSKLKTFDDLKTIRTFGFRGEALASITHVSHVTIQSRTADCPCAYKAKYSDGKLVPLKAGEKADPKPCAGVVGTTITVEDLFFNMPARKSAFKNQNEQYQKILDVVTRYSIHFAGKNISFTCKKQSQLNPDYYSPNSSSSRENIRIAFGHDVAQELLNLNFEQDDRHPTEYEATSASFQVTGLITNANYSCKKNVLVLFINDRLVECASVKKVVDAVYADVLHKHSHPFVYLSLTMPPENIDVNVHPTKKEVHFLYEDVIVDALYQKICACLRGANSSRVFHVNPSNQLHFERSVVPVARDNADVTSTEMPVPADCRGNHGLDDDLLEHDAQSPYEQTALESRSVTADASGNSGREKRGNDTVTNSKPTVQSLANFAVKTTQKQSTSLPAHKFVRTDSKQVKINEIFRAGVAKSVVMNSSGSAVFGESGEAKAAMGGQVVDGTVAQKAENVPEVAAVHQPSCNLSTMEFCYPVGDATTSFSSLCNCCVSSRAGEDQPTVIVAVPAPEQSINIFDIVDTKCQYASVRSLISKIYDSRNEQMELILKNHSIVGVVDSTSFVVQYGTKLLLLDYSLMCRQMLTQFVIRQFGEINPINVDPPIPVYSCLASFLNNCGHEQRLAGYVALLQEKAELLKEYFHISIDASGNLLTVPLIIPQLLPEPEALPMFFFALCTRVNWDSEQECFSDIANHLGFLFSYLPESDEGNSRLVTLTEAGLNKFRTILYPALRRHYVPPKRDSADVIQIAALEELYKVFERC